MRRGIIGLRDLRLFPLDIKDGKITVDVGFQVPWIQQISQSLESSQDIKIHGDDTIYYSVTPFSGLNLEAQHCELPLEIIEKLGFGSYNEATKTLTRNPQGQGKAFGVTFACQTNDDEAQTFLCYKYFYVLVKMVSEGQLTTRGENIQLMPVTVSMSANNRPLDAKYGQIMEGCAGEDGGYDAATLAFLTTMEGFTP